MKIDIILVISILFIVIFSYNTFSGTVLGITGNATTINSTTQGNATTTNSIIQKLGNITNQSKLNIQTLSAITNLTKANNFTNSSANAVNQVFNKILPNSVTSLILAIAVLIFVPVIIDLIYAYRKSPNTAKGNGIVGMMGLYRALMTFGIIIIVGVIAIFLSTLIALNIAVYNPTVQSLIDILKNLGTILGTALATVVAFYFGSRSSESATQKAITTAKQQNKNLLEIVEVDPIDGTTVSSPRPTVNATFSEHIRSASISSDSLILKKVTDNKIIPGKISLTNNKTTLEYIPDNDLEEDKYIVLISVGITGISGNKMSSIKQWSFVFKKS
jgi:hypothetical protein